MSHFEKLSFVAEVTFKESLKWFSRMKYRF